MVLVDVMADAIVDRADSTADRVVVADGIAIVVHALAVAETGIVARAVNLKL